MVRVKGTKDWTGQSDNGLTNWRTLDSGSDTTADGAG